MRPLLLIALLLAPAAAWADDKCPLPRLMDTVQMHPAAGGNVDLVPVRVNGTDENFIFDTGGYYSQIAPATAQVLKLPMYHSEQELFDVRGHVSSNRAFVDRFALGGISSDYISLQLSPNVDAMYDGSPIQGILAPDMLVDYDADMDFGSDVLKLFSQDHCDGQVIYWQPPAMAVIPITMDGPRISVMVTLDGHALKAIVDTGASDTVLERDVARDLFGLTLGAVDTPELGELNDDASLKTYHHVFQNLTFGEVAVGAPDIIIIPDAMGGKAESFVAGGTAPVPDIHPARLPDMIIGMDVWRKLHIYLAFKEQKMYVTPASVPQTAPGETRAAQ